MSIFRCFLDPGPIWSPKPLKITKIAEIDPPTTQKSSKLVPKITKIAPTSYRFSKLFSKQFCTEILDYLATLST